VTVSRQLYYYYYRNKDSIITKKAVIINGIQIPEEWGMNGTGETTYRVAMRREHLATYRSTFTMSYIMQVVVLHTQQRFT